MLSVHVFALQLPSNDSEQTQSELPFFLTIIFCNKSLSLSFTESFSVPGGSSVSQQARYATYFDVAVLRCLMQPHWTEEGVHWALIYYLQRLRQILQEKPERPPEPLIPPLPRPRSSSMVAATPSLVNTHKTQVTIQCQLADGVFLHIIYIFRW